MSSVASPHAFHGDKTNLLGSPCMTWACVLSSDTVCAIEDPMSGRILPKRSIGAAYPKSVGLLNGRDEAAHFDLFFQPSRDAPTTWRLCDQDARDDCLDMIRMMGEA